MGPPYLLDTNHCIAFLRHKSAAHAAVRTRLLAAAPADLFISRFSMMELAEAPWLAQSPVQSRAERAALRALLRRLKRLRLTALDIENFGRIRAWLRTSGQRLEDLDIAIAAAAITHRLTLVTHDRHFQRLAGPFGLQIEDWFP